MGETASVRDGTQLAYRLIKGNGKARVALIHSLAMDATFWDRVTPLLKDHADVLVYDCRGHGGSDKTKGPYTVELFAEDLADLLDRVGWRSATDRKSTRLNSSHIQKSRMPSSA